MPRIDFVQWIRIFLIALVVAHHAGQPYGPTGGEWPVDDSVSAAWLGPFFALNAAYFMGFFFFIAGYFTGGAYDRKGAAAFVRDRLIRLGIPLVFFVFVVFGPVAYLMSGSGEGFFSFYLFTYVGHWRIGMGHLWFIAHLLAYALLYALWRVAARARHSEPVPPPGDRAVFAYSLGLALVGALVRIVYPQDSWVRILWLLPTEPAHLPQYASLFVVGVIAGRGEWFTRISAGLCWRWFAIGIAAFAVAVASYVYGDFLPAGVPPSAAWGILEAFVCVGMILGVTAFFRRTCTRPGRWLRRLEPNVYGVYLVHVFVVVALQMAILEMPLSATAKFLVVTALALLICFPLVAALRRIPPVGRIV